MPSRWSGQVIALDASTGVIMGETDDRVRMDPDPGGLLRRLILLGRLSEQVGRFDSRRLLVDRLLQRLMLFSRMADRLGIAAPENPLMCAVLREAELGCLECADWRRCLRWLDGKSPDDDYRAFCPNEGLFDVLPRQHSVNRPYGIGG
jgi:hypothetical protein